MGDLTIFFKFDRFFIIFDIPSNKDSQVTTKYQRKTAQKFKSFHCIYQLKILS
jgi:CRISPR/Cas system-associated protein endoribonuclease Cas2